MGTVTTAKKQLFGTDWKFPLQVDGQGRLARISGEDNLQQAILMWIKVNIGEILYHRQKGIGIRRYVHLLQSDIAKLAPMEIETGLMKWETRIESVKVTVIQNSDERYVISRIKYKPIGYAIEGTLIVPILIAESTAGA